MRLLPGLGALFVLLGCAGAARFLAQPTGQCGEVFTATGIEAGLSLLVIVAALASIAARRVVAVRVGVAAVLLGTAAVLLGMHLVGRWPFATDPFRDPRYVAFLTTVLLGTVVGLTRRQLWARWVALAFGSFGMLSAGINAANFALAGVRDHWTWMFFAFTLGSALVGLNLADRDVAAAFLARSKQGALWSSRDPLVRVTRWALVANVAAVSMLLVYAWLQPFVAGTSTRAVMLAALLGAGAVLVILRKSAGGLVLGLGGILLFAHLADIAHRGAAQPDLVAYYAVFWTPAALLGIGCAVLVLWRGARHAR